MISCSCCCCRTVHACIPQTSGFLLCDWCGFCKLIWVASVFIVRGRVWQMAKNCGCNNSGFFFPPPYLHLPFSLLQLLETFFGVIPEFSSKDEPLWLPPRPQNSREQQLVLIMETCTHVCAHTSNQKDTNMHQAGHTGMPHMHIATNTRYMHETEVWATHPPGHFPPCLLFTGSGTRDVCVCSFLYSNPSTQWCVNRSCNQVH